MAFTKHYVEEGPEGKTGCFEWCLGTSRASQSSEMAQQVSTCLVSLTVRSNFPAKRVRFHQCKVPADKTLSQTTVLVLLLLLKPLLGHALHIMYPCTKYQMYPFIIVLFDKQKFMFIAYNIMFCNMYAQQVGSV